MSAPLDATILLKSLCAGDAAARDQFAPILHGELKRIARRHLSRERAGHTLAPTELVHEAWLKLVRPEAATFENRRQFFALASAMMRGLLVDHARRAKAERRGGGLRSVTLATSALPSAPDPGPELLLLDETLRRLAEIDGELARIAELRIFGGLELAEVAKLVDLPLRTAERRWTAARTWLRRELSSD